MRHETAKNRIQGKTLLLVLCCVLLTLFSIWDVCTRLVPSHFSETYTQTADAQHQLVAAAITGDTPQGVHNITPLFDTGLSGGNYTVTVTYTAAEDTPLFWTTKMDYDAARDSYPLKEIGTLPAGAHTVSLPIAFAKQEKSVALAVDVQTPMQLSVESVTVEAPQLYRCDRVVFAVFVLLLFGVLAWRVVKIMDAQDAAERRERLTVCLVLGLAFVACAWTLLQPVTDFSYDAAFHLERIQSIAEALSSGQFPHHSGTGFNFGYGFMNSVFYPELFLYFPALLMCLGCSLYTAYKLFCLAVVLCGVLLAYYAFYKICKTRMAALAAAVLYACAPYRLQNMYVRCAMGEVLFLCFLPLVFLGIYNILYKEERNPFILILGCTCVLQSHILGTMITAVLGGVVVLAGLMQRLVQKKKMWPVIKSFLLALLSVAALNAWFLVPLVGGYASGTFHLFSQEANLYGFFDGANGTDLHKLLSFMPVRLNSDVVVSLGAPVWLGAVGAGIYALVNAVKTRSAKRLLQPAVTAVLAGVCGYLIIGMGLWGKLTQNTFFAAVAANLQFTFRLVGPLACLCCLFMVLCLRGLPLAKVGKAVCLVFSVAALGMAAQYYMVMRPGATQHMDSVMQTDAYFYYDKTSVSEYLLKDANPYAEWEQERKVRGSAEVIVTAYEKDRTRMTFSFTNTGIDSYLDVPMLYYKGYHAYDTTSGEELPVTPGENGIIRVQLGARQSGSVRVQYQDNVFFVAANLLSFASAAVLCAMGIQKKKARATAKKPAAAVTAKE